MGEVQGEAVGLGPIKELTVTHFSPVFNGIHTCCTSDIIKKTIRISSPYDFAHPLFA